jgi:hypothetical protein
MATRVVPSPSGMLSRRQDFAHALDVFQTYTSRNLLG